MVYSRITTVNHGFSLSPMTISVYNDLIVA
jgi:hypothetical protein